MHINYKYIKIIKVKVLDVIIAQEQLIFLIALFYGITQFRVKTYFFLKDFYVSVNFQCVVKCDAVVETYICGCEQI